MSNYKVLYNPLSNHGQGEAEAKMLIDLLSDSEFTYIDLTQVKDIKPIVASLTPDEKLIICGGDGTLHRFLNDTDGLEMKNELLYYATGSHNAFLSDIGVNKGIPVPLKEYLGKLPTVTVNGRNEKFINGVGFGIDGYCSEKDSERYAVSDQRLQDTRKAIKGFLSDFKPVNAMVTVDGITYRFQKVWMAPTMFGRFHGVGMIPAPHQNREDGIVSTMVLHNCGRLKALMTFPRIMKGEPFRDEKVVSIFKGHAVSVQFDQPTVLQIDGETIRGVTSYTVKI